MSKYVARAYESATVRYKIYQAVFGKWLSKEQIQDVVNLSSTNAVRSVCDNLISKGYLKKTDSYNKDIKRWSVKYSAVIEKPFLYKSYEQMLDEYNKEKANGIDYNKKGKYDDLIASNPNLKVYKRTDSNVQDSWKRKPQSYYKGIASTLGD